MSLMESAHSEQKAFMSMMKGVKVRIQNILWDLLLALCSSL
jgi:hypothetical protein